MTGRDSNDRPVVLCDRWGHNISLPLTSRSDKDRAFHYLETLARGAFKSSDTNRLNANWSAVNEEINLILSRELKTLRARSRWLENNNPYAIGAINTILNFCVGTGFQLQMNVAKPVIDKEGFRLVELDAFNDYVEDLFDSWGDDVTDQAAMNVPMSFFEFQRIAARRFAVDGEVFYIWRVNKGHDVVPLSLEMIDADYLDTTVTEYNGNPVTLGVEVNRKTWRPLAYWFYSVEDQNPAYPSKTKSIRIPAENVVHVFNRRYALQLRGIPFCAGVAQKFFDLDDYANATLVRNKIAALFGVMVVGGKGGTVFTDDAYDEQADAKDAAGWPVDSNGNRITHLAPGIIGRLPDGYDLKMVNPSSPDATYEMFLQETVKAIGAGYDMGISYTNLTRDTSKTTFAGGRQAENIDFQGFRPFMKLFASKTLSPALRQFISVGVLSGAITAPSYGVDPKFWTRHAWMPGGWARGINPLQEANASKTSMEIGITTLDDECSYYGYDWKIQLRKAAKIQRERERLGLNTKPAEKTPAEEDPEEVAAGEETTGEPATVPGSVGAE